MYKVTKKSLESLADKIRAKAEMAEPLEFPKGFENAVDSIESGITITDANTLPEDVLADKIFYNNYGKQIGTMHSYSGTTLIRPTTETQTINGGQYLPRNIKVMGDPDLIPENIPEDMTFFGVQGTRKMSGGDNTFYNDYWDTFMPTESSLKNSDLSKAKIINRKVFRPNKNIVVKDRQLFYTMNDTRYGLVDVPALCEIMSVLHPRTIFRSAI